MPAIKFSARLWSTLAPAPGEERREFRAQAPQGLWLRVGVNGVRAFGIVYTGPDGRLRRHTLGDASLVPWNDYMDADGRTCAGAATVAREALARIIAVKADPVEEKRAAKAAALRRKAEELGAQQAGTVKHLIDSFLASPDTRAWRPKTRYEIQRLLYVEAVPKLGALKPSDVTRGLVRDLVDAIVERGAGYVANRTLSALKMLFAWALDREHVAASPVAGLKKPFKGERQRDINYSDDEIRAVYAALEQGDADTRDCVHLLFLTASRLNEVLGMEWSELDIDRGEWRLPPERSKIGRLKPRTRVIALVPEAVAILKRRKEGKVVDIGKAHLVFPAARGTGSMSRPTKVLTKLKQDSGVDYFPHATRHVVKAGLARLKVPPHIAERILGHTVKGMEGQYLGTNVEFLDEMREALEAWSAELTRIREAKAVTRVSREGTRRARFEPDGTPRAPWDVTAFAIVLWGPELRAEQNDEARIHRQVGWQLTR